MHLNQNRSGFSCESQIRNLYEDLAKVDNAGRVDAIVYNFAKACDVVPYDVLVQKLDGY